VRTWKDGVYRGVTVLDDDGHGATDIPIRATVTKKGDALTIDLSASAPQVTGFVNSALPNTMSAVHMAFAYLIDPRTPKNSGTFRPVKVILKPGTIVHPNPPAPVTLSTNHCAQEIAESIIKALAPACPERAIAGWGRRFRIAIKGVNPKTGRPFIWHMFHARPGGGATVAGDGWETAGEGQAAGGIKFGSIEVAEARFPLTFEHHEFRADSGGDGMHRGGVGADLRLRVDVEAPAVANTAGDGVRHAPYGLLGGGDGRPHRYRLRSRNGQIRTLKTKEVGIVVRPGDVFVVESSGGGGYGPARRRSAEARQRDAVNGLVSGSARKSARRSTKRTTGRG
jgi:N-methylhydantoinase B